MTWLTWRQFRVQAAVIYAAVAALVVTLAVTAGHLTALAADAGGDFLGLFGNDRGHVTVYYVGFALVMSLPAIVGVFWGAPLIARELEAGTHRLVWSQSVTRTRWLATKLGFTALAAMAAVGLLSLILSWWSGPIDDAVNAGQESNGLLGVARLSPIVFDARGIAPIGYAAFAVALGVTAGLVIRRTVPAMAVTLAVFVAVQIAMPNLVRTHFGPERLITTITATNLRGIEAGMSPSGPVGPVHNVLVALDSPGAWIIANQTLDADGDVARELPSWVAYCVPAALKALKPIEAPGRPDSSGCFERLAEAGYRQRVTYQPAGRYWTLQAVETAIFLGLAGLLAGFCFWRVRRVS